MKAINTLIAIVLLAVCQATFEAAYIDSSSLMKTTVETNYTCSATYFSQYLNNLMEGAAFPKECATPAIDIFSSVDVLFIEEATSFDEYLPSAEIEFTDADSMLPTVSTFTPKDNSTKLICINENAEDCPRSFTVYANLTSVVFGEKNVIYRPMHNESILNDVEEATMGYNLLSLVSVSHKRFYTETEIVDVNIIFVVAILLVIVSVAAVLAVATIDYGEDTAGLYSKFKQDKSQ
ncbi:hypothetical protein WA538_000325 [Blastocystis sp. DL]